MSPGAWVPTSLAWNVGWVESGGSSRPERSIQEGNGRSKSDTLRIGCYPLFPGQWSSWATRPRGSCLTELSTEGCWTWSSHSHGSDPRPGGLREAQRRRGGKLIVLQMLGEGSAWSEQAVHYQQVGESQKSGFPCGSAAVPLGRRKQPLNGDAGGEMGCARGHPGQEFSAHGGPPRQVRGLSEGGLLTPALQPMKALWRAGWSPHVVDLLPVV